MLRIVTHIEHLLLVHDCVIVPQFGGFVLQTVPAMYQAANHTFTPSRKEIVFNSTLQHNDGLLPESYMQMYGTDYRKAVLMLEEDTRALVGTLQQQKTLSLGNIGSFTVGEEGQTIFLPSDATLFSMNTYGLAPFCFPTLESCRSEEEHTGAGEKRRKDVFYIPVSRRFIRVVAASAAAVALFLLVSTPVKDVNQAAYTASFVPTEMVSYKAPAVMAPVSVAAPETVVEDKVETPAPAKAEVAAPMATKEVKAAPAAPAASETAKTPEAVTPPMPQKMYHIVIASFPNEAQANEYMASVKGQCKNVSKVVRDGKYRIYADKYDNREQAENFMADLRKNDKFKDAWLFISR